MALAIKIKIVEDKDATGPLAKWVQIAKNPPKKGEATYIRMPGTSRRGPCPICAQYFFMEHDGSGRVVPMIPLHANCVCSDLLKQFVEAGDDDFKPQPRGGWLKNVATDEQQQSILGKSRYRLLKSGAAKFEQLYKRADGPLSTTKNVSNVGKMLTRMSKDSLVKAARKGGVKGAKKMTRREIINAIIGRETV